MVRGVINLGLNVETNYTQDRLQFRRNLSFALENSRMQPNNPECITVPFGNAIFKLYNNPKCLAEVRKRSNSKEVSGNKVKEKFPVYWEPGKPTITLAEPIPRWPQQEVSKDA